MRDTRAQLIDCKTDFPSLSRQAFNVLQLNLGYRCNLSCTHCHVNAGPRRTEEMQRDTIESVYEVAEQFDIQTVDLTGGAPEMHPAFKELVEHFRSRGVRVIDRCNLTILAEEGYESMAMFLADQGVEVCASLPCYSEANVDKQRGKGVFEHSIDVLQMLNRLGYAEPGSDRVLDLVYNPGGPFLPPEQSALEKDYKARLWEDFGIRFNRLLTITNMPIARFGSQLVSKGTFDQYMDLLIDNYAESNLEHLMCRDTISVDWQGYLYDCDFNQMLNMPMQSTDQAGRDREEDRSLHIDDLLECSLEGRSIAVANHCFGCTAGQGSSCGGALDG